MKNFKIIVLLLLITSCGTIRVNYDFDKTTDFAQYKTYNYYSDMKTGLSDLDTKRFLDVLDLQMKTKGFSLSDTPDFFIDIKSSDIQAAQRNTVGVGLGGGGRNVGGGVSLGIPIGQAGVNRQVTIDFVDENEKQLFWQAIGEYNFNPKATVEKREVLINAIIEKVLIAYPPKQ